jgi:N-carbamoyl-L-amino-acid hydrolase
VIAINPERLLRDLKALRTFGAEGTGVVRPALSPVDIAARHWLVGRMAEAGLEAGIDGIGTVFGRSRQAGKAVLIGSHTDTQPTGGWLDGTLGVVYGLEIARAAAEAQAEARIAVDVAAWADEEGTFSSHTGSRAFAGEDMAATMTARNRDGRTLGEALDAAGLRGRPLARFEPARHVAYLEPHIEQGGRLEAARRRIGVVTSIVGIREYKIAFVGQQNHAGTTPMAIRKDAAATLLAFAHNLNGRFAALAEGRDTVWNIGAVAVSPGAPSVVPGRAELVLQFRDSDPGRLRVLERALTDLVADADRGAVGVLMTMIDEPVEPAEMDACIMDCIARAAEKLAPDQWIRMPSGACHDAQILARSMPSGMLFIPSIGGISHDPAEDTSEDDIVLGCRVAAEAVCNILRGSVQRQIGPGLATGPVSLGDKRY